MVAKRSSALPKVRAAKGAAAASPARGSSPRASLRAVTGAAHSGAPEAGAPLALDRVIHERVRLAIVSALALHDTLTFNDLKGMLDASDGNLSVHARRLEEAGYVDCKKGFEGRIPRTEYRLTAAGQRALERYLSHMEALIRRVGGE